MFVKDIFSYKGSFCNWNTLTMKGVKAGLFLHWNRLLLAIPSRWKTVLKRDWQMRTETEDNSMTKLQLGDVSVALSKLTSKHIYWYYINNKFKSPVKYCPEIGHRN